VLEKLGALAQCPGDASYTWC